MNSIDLIEMAVKNLLRRKLRTFLTVLGIIIGTISIVIMISLGLGMKESFKKEISRMGSINTINVRPSFNQDEYGNARKNSKGKLNDEAVAKISQIQGVEVASPIIETTVKIISGRYMAYVQLIGMKPELMKNFDFKVDKGRLLNKGDKLNIVFGSEVPFQFYNPKSRNQDRFGGGMEKRKAKVNVMKDSLTMTFNMEYGERRQVTENTSQDSETAEKAVQFYKVKAAGILKEGDYEKDFYAFMPINELKVLIQKENKAQEKQKNSVRNKYNKDINCSRVMVKVNDINKVKDIQKEIRDMGYEAESLNDMLESAKKQENIIQLVLGGIGAVSLLVAAIGITNTMVMAIYERRKEIGVMKVIGASVKDIRRLFLLESAFIGLIGGIIGIILCIIISSSINKLGGNWAGGMGSDVKISYIPYWLAISSMGFTTLVGITAGFLPARKATKLSALEAIKTE